MKPRRLSIGIAPVLARLWGPAGRRVLTRALRAAPSSIATCDRALLLYDTASQTLAWAASAVVGAALRISPDAVPFAPLSATRVRPASSLLTVRPTLSLLLDSLHLNPDHVLVCPMREGSTFVGAILVVTPRSDKPLLHDLAGYGRLVGHEVLGFQQLLAQQVELEAYRGLSKLVNVGTLATAIADRSGVARALGRVMADTAGQPACMVLAAGNRYSPLEVIGSKGVPEARARELKIRPDDPPWDRLLDGADRIVVDAAALDRTWQEVVGPGSVLFACVRPQGWLRGMLVIPRYRGLGRPLDSSQMVSVAVHAGLIWQNAELIRRLQKEEEVLEGLVQRAIQVQEEERKRIAADIHDGVTQRLISIWYRVLTTEKLMNRAETLAEAQAEMQVIKGALDTTLKEARAAIYNLRPATLDDLGLVASLHTLVQEFRQDTGIPAQIQVEGDSTRRLPSHLEVGVYRVAQEALSNVKKHAHAKETNVLLQLREGRVRLIVQDDGIGFRQGRRRNKSFGLEGMQERAHILGGDLEIKSHPGTGTVIVLTLNLPKPVEHV
ncbi:MAG: sensor histidine kinase [Candidatus Xenobia bacterium]